MPFSFWQCRQRRCTRKPTGTLTTLHHFTDGGDGAYPDAPVVQGSDGNFYGTTYGEPAAAAPTCGTVFQLTPTGVADDPLHLTSDSDGAFPVAALAQGSDGNLYGTTQGDGTDTFGTVFKLTVSSGYVTPAFFSGEAALGSGVNYLAFSNGNYFGYHSFLSDPHYIYHFDLGYESVFDADDGKDGVYFYDFKSNGFFYTSPTFPFPNLYDFSLNPVVYYYPDPSNAGHYNTNGYRFFSVFSTGKIIVK